MKNIKIYYKGEFNQGVDDLIKDAMGRVSYVLVGCGYNFKAQERDLEFEHDPVLPPNVTIKGEVPFTSGKYVDGI